MGDVVALDEQRPHNRGLARCMECHHEWTAVVIVGKQFFDCERCGLERATFVGACCKTRDLHWTCLCGNDLFHMTPESTYCPNCGRDQILGK